MAFRLAFLTLGFLLSVSLAASKNVSFTYNGFRSADLSLDGLAEITSNGILGLTNLTEQQQGHAYYPNPVTFKNSSNASAFSFSTSFVFAIIPNEFPPLGGSGIAFVISPGRGLPGASPSQYIGLFNTSTNGNWSNHVIAVELDTSKSFQSREFNDIDSNHVGIDINGMKSDNFTPAGYYSDSDGVLRNLTLLSSKPIQAWIDYDGKEKKLDVILAPIDVAKPKVPLLSLSRDLSPYLEETMFVGFSSATGPIQTTHYVLGWSFKTNGRAPALTLSRLPKLPRIGPKKKPKTLTIGVPVICVTFLLIVLSGAAYMVIRKKKFEEVLEYWENDYGPHRFKFKDLHIATQGFKEKGLLGSGGFGRVYRGVLPSSKVEIAVKRVSHESRQGLREFVAEIVSMGRLRHRNLVALLGYCRRKRELLLVYEYMPNGSLDKYLYDQPKVTLNWSQRFGIIKGVASGLFYLHEGWEQVVIHRDVKASNVLLDAEWNARLGDFGLARLYDHGTDPQTTHIVGTLGYLAPEHTRTGKATPSTDVFGFGAFLLEVACGRRPIEPTRTSEGVILVDRVFSNWATGKILDARDVNLGSVYNAEEVELVLKLGLLCSHSRPEARPSMRQVVQFLEGAVLLPESLQLSASATGLSVKSFENFQDFSLSCSYSGYSCSKEDAWSSQSHSVAASLLSGGR